MLYLKILSKKRRKRKIQEFKQRIQRKKERLTKVLDQVEGEYKVMKTM